MVALAGRWREANDEYRRTKQAATRARNKTLNRIGQAHRRAMTRESDLTPERWQEILEYFGNACAYCRRPGVPLEVEHVIAVKRGGSNALDNIVPACGHCNRQKRDRPVWVMAGL